MKHRVEIDISFDNKQDAIDLLNYVEKVKSKAVETTSSKDPILSIKKTCSYHECKHDDTPPTQCGNYTNVNFSGIEVEYK
jgi:hypothetical protein